MKQKTESVQITAPNIQTAKFKIVGTAPLVIHRFDEKTKSEFKSKIETGTKRSSGKKQFAARSTDDEAAKYFGKTGGTKWEGFNASALRLALISACRLVNFKMTLAKLSIFVLEDGRDLTCPLYPLIRINGKSEKTEMIGRTETGVAMLIVRPMYFPWSADIRIRFDAGQFSISDISNLLSRAGEQVGLCEGRSDSKNSGGMGWGTFQISNEK
jgi:hypothetical protein